MADRAISALPTATTLTSSDLFVLSQSNQAKNTTWQTIIGYLTTALDGHGGIQSISKTGTSSLVDTYTITFADETTATFTVTNGRAVSSVTQYFAVSSSNSTEPSTWYTTVQTMTTTNRYLWGYQKITFNDSTTIDTTASVIGVYGDTGENWYVHIKYSGSQPTQDSDIGDTPDNWMGIYAGTESDPSNLHYTDFEWFKIKGETGETGAASAITTQNVSYQASNSGTVAPSGSWTTTIPTVPQGSFLWTRTQLAFNDGTTVTAYSVSRYGIDGTGAVSTVNGVSPDGSGNVAITASDIAMQDNQSIETNVTQLQTDVGDVASLITTASTVVPAINELKTSLNKALTGEPQTRIPSGSNLNNYTTAGTYYVFSDSDATNISNMPQSASGTLFCVYRSNSNSYLMQIYVTTSSIQRVWTRLYNNGTWTQWLRNGGHIVVTGTATTSSGGTASLQETYNTDEWGLVSISAAGAVSGYMLIPYKYGDAANGRWGFFACYSGSMNPIASTSISYRAVLLHL